MTIDIVMNGKVVGKIEGDTYITRRDTKEHFFRKRQGYPISVSILKQLKEKGVKKIIIEEYNRNDRKTKKYSCFVSDFDFIESFKEKGWDEQKCIPLRRMKEC